MSSSQAPLSADLFCLDVFVNSERVFCITCVSTFGCSVLAVSLKQIGLIDWLSQPSCIA